MKPLIIHKIQFEPGKKSVLEDPIFYKRQTESLKGNFNLGIWRPETQRKLSINAYYWGFVIGEPMKPNTPANHFGCFPWELHEDYKTFFNGGRSTTCLSDYDFINVYCKPIIIFMMKRYKILIPDRNQTAFL